MSGHLSSEPTCPAPIRQKIPESGVGLRSNVLTGQDSLGLQVQFAVGEEYHADRANLVKRTAVLVAAVWLPVLIGAFAEKRLLPGESSDPLLRHFGLHARLLIAIPLLIFAEVVMDHVVPPIVRQFSLAGLVSCPSGSCNKCSWVSFAGALGITSETG